jgi:hypothetical protein
VAKGNGSGNKKRKLLNDTGLSNTHAAKDLGMRIVLIDDQQLAKLMIRYNIGCRDEDIQATKRVPYQLLEEVPELSYGDRDTGNMLIQGDNLEALKALLPFYAGQVKCIYKQGVIPRFLTS